MTDTDPQSAPHSQPSASLAEPFAQAGALKELISQAVAAHEREDFREVMEALLSELVERARVALPVDQSDGQILANMAADGKQILCAYTDPGAFAAYREKMGEHVIAAPVAFDTIAQAFATISALDGLVLSNHEHSIFIDRTQIEHCSRAQQMDLPDGAASSPEQAMTVLAAPTWIPEGLTERLTQSARRLSQVKAMWLRAIVQNDVERPALLVRLSGTADHQRDAFDQLWAAVKDLFADGQTLAMVAHEDEDDPLFTVGEREPFYKKKGLFGR